MTKKRYYVQVTLIEQEMDPYTGRGISSPNDIDQADSNITYNEAEAKALFYTVASEIVRAIKE